MTIGGIQALAIAIQFARAKIVAVMIGPDGVGIVSTIDQIVQLAAFVTAFSLPFASVKFLSKAHSEGEESFRRSYAGFLKLLGLIAIGGTGLTIAIVFFRPLVLGQDVAKYQRYVMIALLYMPALILGGFFSNVFASAQKYRVSAALAVITNAVTSTAVIVGILTLGIVGVFWGSSIAGLLLTIGIILYLRKRMDLPFYSGGTNFLSELKRSPKIASFAAMLYFGSVSYSLSLLVARYAILSNYGETETGLFHSAIALSVAIGMVLSPVNGLYLTPIMNRNIEKSEKIAHALEFQRKMIVILILVALPTVMFPELLLTIMFSTRFASVGHLVYLFVLAQVVSQLAGVHQALMIGADDLRLFTIITTTAQVGFALLSWFLVPIYGIKGVAIGGITTSLIIFFSTLLRLKWKHGYVAPRGLILLFCYALAALGATGWISSRLDEWDIFTGALKIVFFCFFAASLLLFLSSKERAAIYGLRRKLLPAG